MLYARTHARTHASSPLRVVIAELAPIASAQLALGVTTHTHTLSYTVKLQHSSGNMCIIICACVSEPVPVGLRNQPRLSGWQMVPGKLL